MDSETFVAETRGQVGRIHVVVPMPRTSHTHSSILPQSACSESKSLHQCIVACCRIVACCPAKEESLKK
jgi:hypothetical protein